MIFKNTILDKWHFHVTDISIIFLVRCMDSSPKESTTLLYSKTYKQIIQIRDSIRKMLVFFSRVKPLLNNNMNLFKIMQNTKICAKIQ